MVKKSLRKKLEPLNKMEIKIIERSIEKKIKKDTSKKIIKNWWKDCRTYFFSDLSQHYWCMIIYHIQTGKLFSTCSIVHEIDETVVDPIIGKKICASRFKDTGLFDVITKDISVGSAFTEKIVGVLKI